MNRINPGRVLIFLAMVFLAVAWVGRAPATEIAESSCILCHSKLSGKAGEPVKLWKESIHQGVGTTCDACHGGDPKDADASWLAHGSSPEIARKIGFLGKPSEDDIPDFCGKCHMNIKDNYSESTHYAMGVPNCVTCHTAHSVKRPSLNGIQEKICSTCHDDSRGDVIGSMILSAQKKLGSVETSAEKYRPYLPSSVEDELNKADTENASLGTVFHTFSMDKIKTAAESLGKKVDTISSEIEQIKKELKKRKKIGIGILIFTLLTAAVLYYYRKLIPIPPE